MIELNEENATIIEYPDGSKNAFRSWTIQAPAGFVVAISFTLFDTLSLWDKYMFISFGEHEDTFNSSTNSCQAWNQVTIQGHIISTFRNFTSRTSSAKLIFSSFIARIVFSIRLQAIRSKGNFANIYILTYFDISNTKVFVRSNYLERSIT